MWWLSWLLCKRSDTFEAASVAKGRDWKTPIDGVPVRMLILLQVSIVGSPGSKYHALILCTTRAVSTGYDRNLYPSHSCSFCFKLHFGQALEHMQEASCSPSNLPIVRARTASCPHACMEPLLKGVRWLNGYCSSVTRLLGRVAQQCSRHIQPKQEQGDS